MAQQAPELSQLLVPTDERPPVRRFDLPLAAADDEFADFDAWQASRARLIAATAQMPVLAATGIARAAHTATAPTGGDFKDEQSDEEAPWKKGRAGTSVGRAVHAVLQTIDLATGAGLDAAARAQAAAEGVDDRLDDIVRFVEGARASRAVQEAVAGGRFWREVYVSALIEGIVVEGFIDMLYETPAGLVVVDYKTDSLRSVEAIDAAVDRYRLQGASYVLALEQSLGRRVARCTFVFVQPHDERDIVDLPAAVQEVRSLLPEALAALNGVLA